jgi:hypothetical protein
LIEWQVECTGERFNRRGEGQNALKDFCRVALNGENEEVAPGAGVAGLSATVHCT